MITENELSAQEAALDKAIGFATDAEDLEQFEGDLYATIDLSKAWSAIAVGIIGHNKSVASTVLAEAAVVFVQSPDPEAYAALGVAVEQYLAER